MKKTLHLLDAFSFLWTSIVLSVSVQSQWRFPSFSSGWRGKCGEGMKFYKKDETKSKNGELFTRGISSNFDKITQLSSPLFNAASCFCLQCRRRRVFSWMKEKRSLAPKVLCFCLRWFKLLLCFCVMKSQTFLSFFLPAQLAISTLVFIAPIFDKWVHLFSEI